MKKLRLYFLASALLMLSQGAWAAITGTGTASDPYVLSSAEDWATFADETNSGTYWATGVYVRMGADITVSGNTTVGTGSETSSTNAYKGVFNGAGHTLTIAFNVTEIYYAPFRYVEGATINNLHVTGTIKSTNNSAAGIVAISTSGTTSISNCWSSVSITSSATNNSGVLARVQGGTVNITDCLFDGAVSTTTATNACGFVSWIASGTSVNAKRCYFKPSNFYVTITNTDKNYSYTIIRTSNSPTYTIADCYYDKTNCSTSGQSPITNSKETDASSMTAANLVTALGSSWKVESGEAVPTLSDLLGSGTEADPYLITCEGDLQRFETYTTASKYFKLLKDLSMSGEAWTGVSGFAGTFDGGGFTISNLAAPFCLTTAGSATIKNLTLEGSLTGLSGTAGAFVCTAGGSSLTMTDCTNKMNLTSTVQLLGGFIGTCTCTTLELSNCENEGNIETEDSNVGGIIGSIGEGTTTTTLTNCTNNGTVKGGVIQVGGLVGKLHNTSKVATLTFTDCANKGSVSTGKYNNYSRVGGFIGWIRQVSGNKVIINNGENTGTITGTGTYAGGFIGYAANGTQVTIDGSTNNGDISAEGCAGGHVGGCYETSISGSSKNTGKITATNAASTNTGCVGGFIGDAKYTISLEYCENEGSITNPNRYGGGLIGHSLGNLSIKNCKNSGASVTNSQYAAGGLVGATGEIGSSGTITDSYTTEYTVEIINSENSANVKSSNQAGGMIGRLGTPATLTITNCTNSGSVVCTYSAAGILGQAHSKTIAISGCSNSGEINTTSASGNDSRASGIIGLLYSASTPVTIEKCWNSGTITGKNKYSGGIIGSINIGTVTIADCYNTGKVTDNTNGMAILGNDASNAASITNCWNNGEVSTSFSTGTCTNCYDLNSSATTGVTQVTADQLASGEVAYKLGDAWYQTIGTDDYPTLDDSSEKVLYIGAAGYSTMYDADNDWALNGDAQAFIGSINGSALHLDEIDDIPAGTAVVLKGTYYNKVSTTATATTTGNVLQGSDGTKKGGSNIYALAKKNDVVGFYPVAASVTIPAGKAYIEYNGAGVKGFNFVFDDEATSLSEELRMKSEEFATAREWYTLDGRKLNNKPTQRGIYIVNGKRILF